MIVVMFGCTIARPKKEQHTRVRTLSLSALASPLPSFRQRQTGCFGHDFQKQEHEETIRKSLSTFIHESGDMYNYLAEGF